MSFCCLFFNNFYEREWTTETRANQRRHMSKWTSLLSCCFAKFFVLSCWDRVKNITLKSEPHPRIKHTASVDVVDRLNFKTRETNCTSYIGVISCNTNVTYHFFGFGFPFGLLFTWMHSADLLFLSWCIVLDHNSGMLGNIAWKTKKFYSHTRSIHGDA